MDTPFRKDLSHLDWSQVYERQTQRAALISDWMDALGLKSGDRVLDIGAGPGFVSLVVAERVGATGIVYAVDRSGEALDFLAHLQRERGIHQIERIVADAADLDADKVRAGSALITMVLHHVDDPVNLLRNVARCLPPEAPLVIGEFHPEGPCSSGPPPEHRLAPIQVEQWCSEAGLVVIEYRRQSPEHYMLVARRGRDRASEAHR